MSPRAGRGGGRTGRPGRRLGAASGPGGGAGRARNRLRAGTLTAVTAVAGKTPEPPHHGRGDLFGATPRYASPARSSASEPARSDASRSSSVKPAGASDSVVTPACA
ncbi:hypothetical protein GCM10020295_66900 [Streptomyces cinereospinus]